MSSSNHQYNIQQKNGALQQTTKIMNAPYYLLRGGYLYYDSLGYW